MHSRECIVALQYAFAFWHQAPARTQHFSGTILHFWAQMWVLRCLEPFGAKLPAKTPLMLGASLGPAHLEDGGQSARKFWGPNSQQKSPYYRRQCCVGANLLGRWEPRCLAVLRSKWPAKTPWSGFPHTLSQILSLQVHLHIFRSSRLVWHGGAR